MIVDVVWSQSGGWSVVPKLQQVGLDPPAAAYLPYYLLFRLVVLFSRASFSFSVSSPYCSETSSLCLLWSSCDHNFLRGLGNPHPRAVGVSMVPSTSSVLRQQVLTLRVKSLLSLPCRRSRPHEARYRLCRPPGRPRSPPHRKCPSRWPSAPPRRKRPASTRSRN